MLELINSMKQIKDSEKIKGDPFAEKLRRSIDDCVYSYFKEMCLSNYPEGAMSGYSLCIFLVGDISIDIDIYNGSLIMRMSKNIVDIREKHKNKIDQRRDNIFISKKVEASIQVYFEEYQTTKIQIISIMNKMLEILQKEIGV